MAEAADPCADDAIYAAAKAKIKTYNDKFEAAAKKCDKYDTMTTAKKEKWDRNYLTD